MRQHAVILTYPAHFYLTKICIKSIKKYFLDCSDITVLVDDTSVLAWDSYVHDCKEMYEDSTVTVQSIKQFNELEHIIQKQFTPWVKQQLIKLHLDLILPYNEIFFTDGDVIFESDIPYEVTPYTRNDSYLGYAGLDYYTSCLLNINSDGIKSENDLIRLDTAAAPFRDIRLLDLKELRQYVMHTTNKNFVDLHVEIAEIDINYISEWELLEVYKQKILNRPIKLLHVHIKDLLVKQPVTKQKHVISTTWTHEKALPETIWDEYDIQIDPLAWRNLPDSKY